jgi:hypothetical protein
LSIGRPEAFPPGIVLSGQRGCLADGLSVIPRPEAYSAGWLPIVVMLEVLRDAPVIPEAPVFLEVRDVGHSDAKDAD